jgi:hypothetical protein
MHPNPVVIAPLVCNPQLIPGAKVIVVRLTLKESIIQPTLVSKDCESIAAPVNSDVFNLILMLFIL